MDENIIISRVTEHYPDAIIDVAGEDCSFQLYIISKQFEGKNTLQRQQSILSLFKDELANGQLHALSVKAKTKKEQAIQAGSGLVQIKLCGQHDTSNT